MTPKSNTPVSSGRPREFNVDRENNGRKQRLSVARGRDPYYIREGLQQAARNRCKELGIINPNKKQLFQSLDSLNGYALGKYYKNGVITERQYHGGEAFERSTVFYKRNKAYPKEHYSNMFATLPTGCTALTLFRDDLVDGSPDHVEYIAKIKMHYLRCVRYVRAQVGAPGFLELNSVCVNSELTIHRELLAEALEACAEYFIDGVNS